MIRGEGTAVISGVTIDDVFDFVMDPAQYTKADTKIIWVTKIADTEDGMIGLEEGKFLGRFKGSVVTRYRWTPDKRRIDVTLVHGFLKSLHAWFELEPAADGVQMRHVEEMEMAGGPAGKLMELAFGWWLQNSVPQEVNEIKRLMEEGERGKGI